MYHPNILRDKQNFRVLWKQGHSKHGGCLFRVLSSQPAPLSAQLIHATNGLLMMDKVLIESFRKRLICDIFTHNFLVGKYQGMEERGRTIMGRSDSAAGNNQVILLYKPLCCLDTGDDPSVV